MNYKNVFKRETKVIAYVVIALTLVAIGTSYALFLQVNNNRDNQIVTAGSLVIEYAKGNTITVDENAENNCLIPQSDSTGASTGGCKFTLSVTNTGTLPMVYDLLIYDNTTDAPKGAEFVDHSLVRHSLRKQISKEDTNSENVTQAKSLDELPLKENKRVLESAVIDVGETILFTLNIWISEEATSDIIGQYVYLKLDVTGVVYENDASQELTSTIEMNGLDEVVMPTTFSESNHNNEYRYSGANPDNYVYFNCSDDSEKETCEVWRILGIYNSNNENYMKLIQEQSEMIMAFNTSEEADFSSSSINTYLNETFYNNLNATAKKQIRSFYYKLGSSSDLNVSALEMYGQEITNDEEIKANVGLMSISDYGFASSMSEEDKLNSVSERNTSNWLYSKKDEWLINKDENNNLYALDASGEITAGVATEEKLIRPVVYLNKDIKIIDGDGSSSNPFILSQ